MPEQKELIGHSVTATFEALLPVELLRDDLYASYAFAVGKLYLKALNRGWDDIAEDLLADLHRHGFYMVKDKELGSWVIRKNEETK